MQAKEALCAMVAAGLLCWWHRVATIFALEAFISMSKLDHDEAIKHTAATV